MAPLLLAQLAVAAAAAGGSGDPGGGPAIGLTVVACVDADREELRRLLEVEYRGPLGDGERTDLTQVIVRCTEERNEVRVLVPRRPKETVRTVDLSGMGPVAKEAKTRELALVIAELVRSAQTAEAVAETVTVQRAPEKVIVPEPPSRWTQVGALITAEKYSGGQTQLGPGMAARFAVTRYFTAELQIGARWSESLGAPDGTITSRGFVGGVGAGIDAFPDQSRGGLLLMARAELEWLRIQGNDESGAVSGRTVSGAAVIASAAPCGWIRLGRSLRMLAEPAVLLPLHTVVIEDQGQRVSALSGVGVAATLGIMAHF